MAAAQVLNSPELLLLILEHFNEQNYERTLEDLNKPRFRSAQSSLAKFARLNSLWFETATRVLWAYEKQGPTLVNLDNIETCRRQIYASKLVSIRTQDRSEYVLDTTALSFPRARKLDFQEIGREPGLPATSIKQYLRPPIDMVDFRIWDDSFNKELLTGIKSQCPRLRSLKLTDLGKGSTEIMPEDFNEFFRNQQLELVYIDVDSPLVTKELISTFGAMKTLESLSILSTLSLQQIPECFLDEGTQLFKSLHHVEVRVTRKAMRSVTMAARNVSSAKITVEESTLGTPVFSNVKHMRNLVDLTIHLRGGYIRLNKEDFGHLRTLENLEYLVLKSDQQSALPPTTIAMLDSSIILDAILGLPQLHSFNWHICWLNVSVETLSALSRHNPKLRNLILYGALDLQALGKVSGCLFPNLQTLMLSRAVLGGHRGQIPFKRIATQILHHAPKLQMLSFTEDPQSKVVNTWKKHKEEEETRLSSITYKVVRPSQNPLRKIPLLIDGKVNVDRVKRPASDWQRILEGKYGSRPDPRDPRFRRAEAPEPQTSSS